MNHRSVLYASMTALVVLMMWWVGILYLDGALALMLPYDQYSLVSLLYPDVYYPALPGWALAHAQPYSFGVLVVAIGWMVVLSGAIGAGATKVASDRNLSPTISAAAIVIALFVVVTAIEAAVALIT